MQALTPAPGELAPQPPHRSRLTRSTQAAGHQDRGKSRRGFGRLRHRCALRAILPLRQRLLTSARSARVLTQGDCRTERPTALRREPSRSTSPGKLPAQSSRELASSQPFMHAGHSCGSAARITFTAQVREQFRAPHRQHNRLRSPLKDMMMLAGWRS